RSTMRTEGEPLGAAVASATASGTSTATAASSYQRRNCSSGSAARSLRRSSRSGIVLHEQPALDRDAHELGAGGEPELLHDPCPVRLGRAHGDVELLRDLLIRVAEREQFQDLALTVRERVGLLRCADGRVVGGKPRAELVVDVVAALRHLADRRE